MPINYYETLGFVRDSPAEYKAISLREITKSYRKKALNLHPDKIKDSAGRATDGKASPECLALLDAHAILSNSDKRKAFDDALKDNFPAYRQQSALHFHSALEPTNSVDVTSLIYNTKMSADYLLEQAITNLNFAQALMSASSVFMTFTLQQQYQLLFCLIEHGMSQEAILNLQNIGSDISESKQSNAEQLVSLLKTDDEGTASKECLQLLFTRLIQNKRDPVSYGWILEQLDGEDIRTIALSDGARWPLVLYCLRQSTLSFDIIDIIFLMGRFASSQGKQLRQIYLTAAPNKQQQFEDCLDISESKDEKESDEAVQRLVQTAQPELIVKLAKSFKERENQPTILITALFQEHSDLTTVYSEGEFINQIILRVLVSAKDGLKRDKHGEENYRDATDSIMQQMFERARKQNELLLKMITFMVDSEAANKSTVAAKAILSICSGSALPIGDYTTPCQAQWLRLFFPKTDQGSGETVELFVSLIQQNPVNHLLDFLTGNELISRKFLQIFHQTFDSYQDGENIIKQIVPMVDALGLKKDFLRLFPTKQDYYAKFEQVKKCTKQYGKIKRGQFDDVREVLTRVQKEWFSIKFSNLDQALSILPSMLDYVTAKKSSDDDHQLLKLWISNLPESDDQEKLCLAVIRYSKIKKNYQNLFIKLLDQNQPEHFSHCLFKWLWRSNSFVPWLNKHLPACQTQPSPLLNFSHEYDWRVRQMQYQYAVIQPKAAGLSSLRELLSNVADTDQFLIDLCEQLTTVVVDEKLLKELESALQHHSTLLFVLLSRIETGDIPSVGELSLGACRQKVLSKNPKQPEMVFLSCAKQFLHDQSHQIAGDQLLAISQAFGADIEPVIIQLKLCDKLNAAKYLKQIIEQSQQHNAFSLAKVDYEQQWIDIVEQLKQLAAFSWRESMSCTGMQALYRNLLGLNQDKLTEQSQSVSQALLRRFPHEHPKNLIRWVLQIALDQDGSQLSELAIRAWLTQPDFIDHFTGTSSFDDVMLSIIASDSSSPIIIELKQQFISCLIKKPKLSVSFSQYVLADPKKLTAFVAGLTKHLTLTEPSSLTVDQWLNVYTQLLSQLATLGNWVDLLPIVTKGLISVVTFIVAHDRLAEIPRGGTWIKQSLSFDLSRSVRPPNNEACQAMHAIICLLLLMQHPGDAADFFNQELLSGLTSLAARQSDFPDVIHDFVIQRLIQMNLFPDLLQKIESLFLDDEQEAQGLLNYLAKKSVKSIDAEEKESASQSEAQTSLLGCVRKEAYVNADDVIIEQFQRLKEEQLVHQSTPYLDRLLGLLDSYLYRSMDWSNEQRIQHLRIISALLKQLPNTTSTISKECVELLQGNIIKERMSLQVHHASEEAFPIPMMDEQDLLPLRLRVNHWHDCLSDTQKTQVLSRVDNAESLEQHYHHHFQDFLHLKSYVDLKFYQDWHLKFIADKGDYDSALYRLNQLLHQYVQTCASLDVSTRRTQIRRLLQFVSACDSLDYLSGELKEALQHRIENEYEFVYHHLSHRPGAALNLRTSQDHSSSPLDQRSWYRKLWSWMHRFLNQEHVESVYINASRQPVKYALVDEAHFCQHLLTLEQLDYGQWQTLLTFYQKAMDANEGLTEAVDEKAPPVEPSPNQRYMKDVAGKICQRLVGDEPDKAWYKTSRTYLATNFAKVKPILQQLYRSHQSFRKIVEALANDKAVSDPCSLKGKLYRALITRENVEEASGRVQGSSELPKAAGSSHSFRQRHGMFSCWLGKKAPANTLSATESEETLPLSVRPGSS